MSQRQKQQHKILHLRLLGLVLALLLFYVVVPQLSVFKSGLGLLRNSKLEWMALAWGSAILTYAFAALVYVTLVGKNLKLGSTIAVQLAASFANRLLPIGIGALGTNYFYLRKQHLSQPKATAVVALNNIVGFVGHVVLFLIVILSAQVAFKIQPAVTTKVWILVAIVTAVVVLVLALVPKLRTRLVQVAESTLHDLAAFRHHPLRLLFAVPVSIFITLTYAFTLFAAARALRVDVTFAQSFIVLTVGVLGATVAPTPGGLLGAEAGLVTGLLAYGASSGEAIAVALLYRLLTYWMSLLLGGIAFVWARRMKLF